MTCRSHYYFPCNYCHIVWVSNESMSSCDSKKAHEDSESNYKLIYLRFHLKKHRMPKFCHIPLLAFITSLTAILLVSLDMLFTSSFLYNQNHMITRYADGSPHNRLPSQITKARQFCCNDCNQGTVLVFWASGSFNNFFFSSMTVRRNFAHRG